MMSTRGGVTVFSAPIRNITCVCVCVCVFTRYIDVIYATADEAGAYMFYRCFFCFPPVFFPSVTKYETTVLGNC